MIVIVAVVIVARRERGKCLGLALISRTSAAVLVDLLDQPLHAFLEPLPGLRGAALELPGSVLERT